MRHVNSIDALALDACELTIGSFDGIHKGHRQLIRQMLDAAQAQVLPTTVLSFFPHPSVVLRGRKPAFYLSSPDEKAERLGALGVDYVINQLFDVELSRLHAAEFLDWIQDRLHPKGLWVGPDFALGYQREGDIAYLKSVAKARDFRVHVVDPALIDGDVVSSTRIRQALRAGDVGLAGRLMGAPFSVPGDFSQLRPTPHDMEVVTLSLEISEERACPVEGLYAGRLESEDEDIPLLIHVRHAPQADDDDPRPSQVDVFLRAQLQPRYREARLAFIERIGPAVSSPLAETSLADGLRAAQELQNPNESV